MTQNQKLSELISGFVELPGLGKVWLANPSTLPASINTEEALETYLGMKLPAHPDVDYKLLSQLPEGSVLLDKNSNPFKGAWDFSAAGYVNKFYNGYYPGVVVAGKNKAMRVQYDFCGLFDGQPTFVPLGSNGKLPRKRNAEGKFEDVIEILPLWVKIKNRKGVEKVVLNPRFRGRKNYMIWGTPGNFLVSLVHYNGEDFALLNLQYRTLMRDPIKGAKRVYEGAWTLGYASGYGNMFKSVSAQLDQEAGTEMGLVEMTQKVYIGDGYGNRAKDVVPARFYMTEAKSIGPLVVDKEDDEELLTIPADVKILVPLNKVRANLDMHIGYGLWLAQCAIGSTK